MQQVLYTQCNSFLYYEDTTSFLIDVLSSLFVLIITSSKLKMAFLKIFIIALLHITIANVHIKNILILAFCVEPPRLKF